MDEVIPVSMKDALALIQAVFPAQKISFEAQKERKANLGQTLTGLGSYWKGRKPLILVRAIVLGSLLPQTGDSKKDLEIFEKLMAFDDHGLARRAFVQNDLKPKHIAARISLSNPWDYFTFTGRDNLCADDRQLNLECPFDADQEGIALRWDRSTSDEAKVHLIEQVLGSLSTYEEKAIFCKRPEEVDQAWLYAPIWPAVNDHYAKWGITARSIQGLIKKIGKLRFGHRPRVGDTFAGGGSIPFESARIGCDVYASDLNPIACMLTWGALNVVGANSSEYAEFEIAQQRLAKNIKKKVRDLAIETDEEGNVAKAYIYCVEVRCPETGWMVPLSPSWVISKSKKVTARLIPNHAMKNFAIEVHSGVSADDMERAGKGTVQDGYMVYEIDGKTYRTSIKSLRGDFRNHDGTTTNNIRKWEMSDFQPHANDIFQERLYAIHWIRRDSFGKGRLQTNFATVTKADIEREERVKAIVNDNIKRWQKKGLVPDMPIEPGIETTRLYRERGWTYWHHLFNARHLLLNAILKEEMRSDHEAYFNIVLCRILNVESKMSRWSPAVGHDLALDVFYNMALNTFYNYGCRASISAFRDLFESPIAKKENITTGGVVLALPASEVEMSCDLFITDPPYADAVHYHEITEYFIAWLRKNPPAPFDKWVWDSRRALAIKGTGDDFRRGMINAYSAMAENMPDNGMQCVMFTHQDTEVWSDMVGIFWAAGLQVVAAWYIATETTSELKKGGYVQGTVILMLRKRPVGERSGFKQRILPAVRTEVKRQIENMMHLNDEVKDKFRETVFNDSDLQMAGYAAALKVLTAYTHIGGEDVTSFALRPRQRGEETIVDEIVQQAAEAANNLLVPEGLEAETWSRLTGIQRFYLRMMDMETTGSSKLDNYQNFAKAFRVADYGKLMGSMAANSARLKRVTEFASRDLTDSTEIGPTWLGRLIIGLQQFLEETEPAVVVGQIQADLPDFLEIRPLLIDMLSFFEQKASEEEVRNTAEILGGRLKNLRAFNQ